MNSSEVSSIFSLMWCEKMNEINSRPQTVLRVLLTARHEIESVWIHGQAGDGVQVSHHGVNQLPAIVVEELDVSVLLRRDGDGQRGVAEHLVDLAGGAWSAGSRPATISAVAGSESFCLKKGKLCKV